jgi:hypothetical protein
MMESHDGHRRRPLNPELHDLNVEKADDLVCEPVSAGLGRDDRI